MAKKDGLQAAGEVLIERLKLVSSKNIIIDLLEFLAELNIYEDMFHNCMHGNIVLTDSRNLIEKLPLVGDEYLMIKIRTPSFETTIEKTFRVYKVSDRNIVRDTNTQNFILHFSSIELFYDILLPLYLPFQGDIHSVVGEIFQNFISANREYEISNAEDQIKEIESTTSLILLNETSNKVKFVSPGWTPFKCINWLASKSIPKNETSKNYLFFESNKSFYFGSIEYIFKDAFENNNYLGDYTISVSNIRDGNRVLDINREMHIASDVNMPTTSDYIKNYNSGYLSNRLIELDLYNKTYESYDYDYILDYKNAYHTSGPGEKAIPIFTEDSLRNPSTDVSFYPKNEKLFDDFSNNVNERMNEIHGNRKSSLLDLSNLKINMTIPGRTDIEVGRVMYLKYPSLELKTKNDTDALDKDYSGFYLVTAINHKINRLNHTMTIEGIKDSLLIDK